MKSLDIYVDRIIGVLYDGPAVSDEIRCETKCKSSGMRELMVKLCKDGRIKHRRFLSLNFEQTGGKMVDMWMLPEHAKYFGGGDYQEGV